MECLKILFFNWRCWFNPEMGGAEVFTREVAKRWAMAGHEVTLFTSEYTGSKKEEESEGVRIVRDGGKYSVYLKARRYYKRVHPKERFDVVVDEINTVPFMAPKFVEGGTKVVPLIHQLAREYWFYEMPSPLSHIGYRFLEERWLRAYRKLPTVTVSESTRADLLKLGFESIFVVGEGLNFNPIERPSEKEKRPVVVFAGRLKKAKRPDHAIEAFRIVRREIPQAELWVIGDGYLREKLERDAPEGVKFFGRIPTNERRELIKRAWVLVNPGVREGFGLNVIEANALGVPCVAYDVNGLRDAVLNGSTGLLVEPGEVRALAQGLIRILSDDETRARMSFNALEHSRGFSWDEVASKFLEVLKSAVGIHMQESATLFMA
ncbi:MAG: glycosyltransferase family 4 protein [Candidatus Verstraetearchaeota archaeon]|nr:glycosyltransferase family 4 protein [Candidatus Verstraetearchaeota archaeon]